MTFSNFKMKKERVKSWIVFLNFFSNICLNKMFSRLTNNIVNVKFDRKTSSPNKIFLRLSQTLSTVTKFESILCIFFSVRKLRLILKLMASQTGQHVIAIRVLFNISRSQSNQTMKFRLENYTQNAVGKLVPDPFIKNQNWTYLLICGLKCYIKWRKITHKMWWES